MKSILNLTAGLMLLFSTVTIAQSLNVPAPSPLQTVKQAFGTSDLSIEYSRPSAKGRVIFGNVVEYGKIWRTGANQSTKFTFTDDVKIEGTSLKAGTYAIYSIPNKDKWEILIYKDLKLGGNVSDYKAENELARLIVSPSIINDKVETFTIQVSNITANTASIEMTWENTKVSLALSTDIDTKIMKNIENSLIKDNRPYFSAATYYFENDKDQKQAMEWINKALTSNPDAYWMHLLKAKIAVKQNDAKTAKASAMESNRLATIDKDDSYIKQSQEIINKIK